MYIVCIAALENMPQTFSAKPRHQQLRRGLSVNSESPIPVQETKRAAAPAFSNCSIFNRLQASLSTSFRHLQLRYMKTHIIQQTRIPPHQPPLGNGRNLTPAASSAQARGRGRLRMNIARRLRQHNTRDV